MWQPVNFFGDRFRFLRGFFSFFLQERGRKNNRLTQVNIVVDTPGPEKLSRLNNSENRGKSGRMKSRRRAKKRGRGRRKRYDEEEESLNDPQWKRKRKKKRRRKGKGRIDR